MVYLITILNYDIKTIYELENLSTIILNSERDIIPYLESYILLQNPNTTFTKFMDIDDIRIYILNHFGKIICIQEKYVDYNLSLK